MLWLLRLPLEMKLLIPNLITIIGVALIAFTAGASGAAAGYRLEYIVFSMLAIGAALDFALVRLALRPVKAMQLVAEQVANGDSDARVVRSDIADVGLARLGVTFNHALECLAEVRERVRERGARVVEAQERERARVALELHESIGQTLAAASYRAAAAANASRGKPSETNALEVTKLLRIAIEDLRSVSRELHPLVTDDLGLPAALESLSRSTMNRSLLDVHVSVKCFNSKVSSSAASTLYRIAREILLNIERHASVGTVAIVLSSDERMVQLEIDDNCFFDGDEVQQTLAAAGERLSLLGGELVAGSNFLGGTKVIARLKRQREAA